MSFLFGRARTRTNTLEQLPKQAREHVLKLERLEGPAAAAKAEELAKVLAQMKQILVTTPGDAETNPDQIHQLVTDMIAEDLLYLLAVHLHRLPFEGRKDAQVIMSCVFRFRPSPSSQEAAAASSSNGYNTPDRSPTGPEPLPVAMAYVIDRRPQILIELCRNYNHKDSATPAGQVLRELIKHEAAAAVILYDDGPLQPGSSTFETGPAAPPQLQPPPQQQQQQQQPSPVSASSPTTPSSAPQPIPAVAGLGAVDHARPQSGRGVFWSFFDWIDKSTFEVSADAFGTFRELVTRHKELVPRYLAANFDLFFERYNGTLVQSGSYVTKRQSIKLLGEILLDRSNYGVMTAYVDRGEHLKICMNLLRDDRKMVQYEGFHVFKVFVANPHKSLPVQRILLMNRDKLLAFLSHFLEDRTDDEQFIDEREFLIKQIRNMPATPVAPAGR